MSGCASIFVLPVPNWSVSQKLGRTFKAPLPACWVSSLSLCLQGRRIREIRLLGTSNPRHTEPSEPSILIYRLGQWQGPCESMQGIRECIQNTWQSPRHIGRPQCLQSQTGLHSKIHQTRAGKPVRTGYPLRKGFLSHKEKKSNPD